MGFKLFSRRCEKSNHKPKDEISKLLENKELNRYISGIIKSVEREIENERVLPVREDDLFDYIDYESLKKLIVISNKKGFELWEEDIESYITHKLEEIAYEKFKKWVVISNPEDYTDIIKLFLTYDAVIKDEIELIIDDVDIDFDDDLIDSIIGYRFRYLNRILEDYGIKLKKKDIFKEIRVILHNERAKKFEEELKSQFETIKNRTKHQIGNEPPIKWENLSKMDGREFEYFVGNIFKAFGFDVVKTRSTNDQGADLIVSKDDLKIVIQTKRYNDKNRVGNRAVQEITAAIKYYGADKGMVITTSEFTKSAIELAEANGIKLIDGKELKRIIDNLNSIYHILLT